MAKFDFKCAVALVLAIFTVAIPLAACGKSTTATTAAPDIDSDTDVDPVVDPDDEKTGIPKGAELTAGQNKGYSTIMRIKSSGELMFSPSIPELSEIFFDNDVYGKVACKLEFTIKDADGKDYYTYPTVTVVPNYAGSYFDIYLQSSYVDCGFCPTAERVYDVGLTVLINGRAKYFGNYTNITVPSVLAKKSYYNPTDIPAESEIGSDKHSLLYRANENGSVSGDISQQLAFGESSTSVTAVPDEGFKFLCWSDGCTDATRSGDTASHEKAIFAEFCVLIKTGNFASIYIDTADGEPIRDKNNYKEATLTVKGASAGKYNATYTTQVRGRGNSSFNATATLSSYDSKNSYRIKLDTKEKLLGVGESKNRDWVLNANKFDASNLRCYSMWTLANSMNTLPFVPSCTWVALYINGDYRGVYMLTDLVEVASDRVEIDDSWDGNDTGFLVELNFRGNNDGKRDVDWFYIDGFEAECDNLREWVVKSSCSGNEQFEFIKSYMQNVSDTIATGNRAEIEKLVDIASFVDMYIIEELSKDCDMGAASMFYQRDRGGKLYCTSPWDYDFGMGTYGPAETLEYWVTETENDPNAIHQWYVELWATDWFKNEVYTRMTALKGSFDAMIDDVKATAVLLKPDSDLNDQLWKTYGNGFHQYVSYQTSYALADYDEHIEFLTNWMKDRWAWMLSDLETKI